MDFQTHVHLGAWHDSSAFGTTANPGLGVLVREEDFLAGVGVWRNSLREVAPYGFAGWQPLGVGPLRAGGALGATKYRQRASLVGGALLTYIHKGREWHLLLTPKVKNYAPAAVELSVSF
jgi:hypothetical protein